MPVISIPVSVETKVRLDAFSTLMQVPLGRVIEILSQAYLTALEPSELDIIKGLTQAAIARLSPSSLAPRNPNHPPIESYKFSRLCFKREVIERLNPQDRFRVETPVGIFEMAKEDFYRVFPNVVQSKSYVQDGMYHYRVLPKQAEQFRVTT
jgi:hypothetical protein